jgi:hypothetical protein
MTPPAAFLTDSAYWAACAGINWWQDCRRRIEAVFLPRPTVSRRGSNLLISIDSGRSVVLRDTLPDNDQAVGFTYAGYVPSLHAQLVHETYYEGTGWLLVFTGAGRRLELADPPIPSPDSARFVVISSDIARQIQPTSIEVYRMRGDTAERELLLQPNGTSGTLRTGNWGPSGATWITNDSVVIRTEVLTWPEIAITPGKPVALVRADGHWSLVGSAR